MNKEFEKYVEYIKNVGGSIETPYFDDDWVPIGPMIRYQMADAGIISRTLNNEGLVSLENKTDDII